MDLGRLFDQVSSNCTIMEEVKNYYSPRVPVATLTMASKFIASTSITYHNKEISVNKRNESRVFKRTDAPFVQQELRILLAFTIGRVMKPQHKCNRQGVAFVLLQTPLYNLTAHGDIP